MADTQFCLAQEGELQLSQDEQKYLVWAEEQKADDEPVVDFAALKEIGLSEKEIRFLKLMSDAEAKYCTPAGCGLSDTSRYLLWDVQYFPKTDKVAGKITVQSFLNSVGVNSNNSDAKREDYFLCIRYSVKHAVDGKYPETALLRIYKKVLNWCLEFEKKHGLQEKKPIVVEMNSESGESDEPDVTEFLKTEEKIESVDETKITEKQKGYLGFLMTMIQNDRLRQDLQKRMNLLSKIQATRIIDALVSGNEERIADFF